MARIEVTFKVSYDEDVEHNPLRHMTDLTMDTMETLWAILDLAELMATKVEAVSATRDGKPI